LAEYCVERLKCYERRRAVQITDKWRQLRLSSNISRFCTLIMNGTLSLTNKSKLELLKELKKHNFDKHSQIYPKDVPVLANPMEPDIPEQGKRSKQAKAKTSISNSTSRDATDLMNDLSDFEDDQSVDDDDDETTISASDTGYDYLLKIPMVSATKEKVKQLEKQMVSLQSQVASLVHTTAKEMWLHELSILQPKLEAYIKHRHDQAHQHPFAKTPSYKSVLQGTSPLTFSATGARAPVVEGVKATRKRAAAGTKKATTTTTTTTARAKKGTATTTRAKKSTTSKKATTTRTRKAATKAATGTTTPKPRAKRATAAKTRATRKKTTADTLNEPILYYTQSMPQQQSTVLPPKPSIIPHVYNDENSPQLRF